MNDKVNFDVWLVIDHLMDEIKGLAVELEVKDVRIAELEKSPRLTREVIHQNEHREETLREVMNKNQDLATELTRSRDAERDTSDAYVRLREILGALYTPTLGSTLEQMWAHTENKARQAMGTSTREVVLSERVKHLEGVLRQIQVLITLGYDQQEGMTIEELCQHALYAQGDDK